jgi:hypothetical protein
VIVDYIDEHKERFGVEPICRVLTDAGTKIGPSSYCAAKTRRPSARSLSDAVTTTLIEKVHGDNFGVYGAPKVPRRAASAGASGGPVHRGPVDAVPPGGSGGAPPPV